MGVLFLLCVAVGAGVFAYYFDYKKGGPTATVVMNLKRKCAEDYIADALKNNGSMTYPVEEDYDVDDLNVKLDKLSEDMEELKASINYNNDLLTSNLPQCEARKPAPDQSQS